MNNEQGGLPSNDQVTVALITDCSTITVHVGKHYKALWIQEQPFHSSDILHKKLLTAVSKHLYRQPQ